MKRRTILKQWNRYLKSCVKVDIDTAKNFGDLGQWNDSTGQRGNRRRLWLKQMDAINLVTNSGVLWPKDKVSTATAIQLIRYKKASAGRLRCVSRCARPVALGESAVSEGQTGIAGD